MKQTQTFLESREGRRKEIKERERGELEIQWEMLMDKIRVKILYESGLSSPLARKLVKDNKQGITESISDYVERMRSLNKSTVQSAAESSRRVKKLESSPS